MASTQTKINNKQYKQATELLEDVLFKMERVRDTYTQALEDEPQDTMLAGAEELIRKAQKQLNEKIDKEVEEVEDYKDATRGE